MRANNGVSAVRAFHHSIILAAGSLSTSATGPKPARSAWTARCPAIVVLPDLPFWEATAIISIFTVLQARACGSRVRSPAHGSYANSPGIGGRIGGYLRL